MSCYVVSEETISAIVLGFERYHVHYYADNYNPSSSWLIDLDEERQQIGQSLLEMNYLSVNIRYNENTPTPRFNFKEVEVNPGIIHGCIRCYNYQTCEIPMWETTDLYDSLKTLDSEMFEAMIRKAGYEVPWGI